MCICMYIYLEKFQIFQALTDWKSKVKVKASKLRCSLSITGGGHCDTPPLTDLEEKLLSLMGKKCLEGDDTQELGQCSSSKTENSKKTEIMGIDIEKESNLVSINTGCVLTMLLSLLCYSPYFVFFLLTFERVSHL